MSTVQMAMIARRRGLGKTIIIIVIIVIVVVVVIVVLVNYC